MSGCCRWCAGFIFTLGLTSLFMWLSFRPSKPKLFIVKFEVPALNKTASPTFRNPPSNASISFDLELENPNKDKGIYYDAINLSLFYSPNLSAPIGNLTIPSFYQGYKKTAHKPGSVEGRGAFWESAWGAVSATGKTSFKVRVETKVRYKILRWKTRHHGLNLTADVEVNDQGTKSGKKGAKLGSEGVSLRVQGYRAQWVIAAAVTVVLLVV